MKSVDEPELVHTLRRLARAETAPSTMLRQVISRLAPEPADRQDLVRFFAAAFCFSEGQAHPIFGWLPDGTGELQDADLDYLLKKRIQQTRAAWDGTERNGSPRQE